MDKKIIIFLLIISLGIIGYLLYKNETIKSNIDIINQNKKALNDSLRKTTNLVGDLESSINILVSEKEELSNLNEELSNELEKEKGKIYQLNKINTKLRDSIKNIEPVIIYIDTSDANYTKYGFEFEYDTTYSKGNYRRLTGIMEIAVDTLCNAIPLNTDINKDEFGFSLVTGLREKDGQIEIFARSDYPNLEITDIKGVIIDPNDHPVIKKFIKEDKFHIGPYIGVGISGELKFNLQVGVGVNYSLFSF